MIQTMEKPKEQQTGEWSDWRWQLRNTIRTIDQVEDALGIHFEEGERAKIEATMDKFPMAVTPYYLSLVDPENYKEDPVFMQCFPSVKELDLSSYDMADPLHEDHDSPAPGITHRYPDRVLFHISNVCAMYCRHCTRKRKVGDQDSIPSREQMEAGIAYIRSNPVVRDVLLSGGDPFLLSNEALAWILDELAAIDHVEVVRIGTRTPVVLPQRITEPLLEVLRRHDNIWINTHFNHPNELTGESREAVKKLVMAGIPMGNQSVLLAGINDSTETMKRLVHQLVASRIRPYYLYQCDLSEGLSHFRTNVGTGIEIMESLRGHTSGFAIPTYVIDAPGGGGKIPVMPNYLVSWSSNKVILRNYEGVITTYTMAEETPAVQDASANEAAADESEAAYEAIGVSRLLSEHEDITLTPENLERASRNLKDDEA